MPNEQFEEFWQAISVIEAQQMILATTANDYPHGTKNSRKKTHKSMHEIAFPEWDDLNKKTSVSPAEIIAEMTKKMRSHGR